MLAAAALAAVLFAAGWTANGWRKDATLASVEAERALERRDQALAQVNAVDRARLEEQRRTAAQTEIANAATKEIEAARNDARSAGVAADRLRQRVAELVAANRAAGNPAAPDGSHAAGDPLDVLTDVLSRADARAGELAEYADRARVAGLACERSYRALSGD